WFSAHPIQQLILEITERDALLDVDYRIARELHRKNVKLAIDDSILITGKPRCNYISPTGQFGEYRHKSCIRHRSRISQFDWHHR
ncbi:hypothetical protein L1003_24345, partial [Escherichia coli]|nr:hypothetical protein [Escherichia coli]